MSEMLRQEELEDLRCDEPKDRDFKQLPIVLEIDVVQALDMALCAVHVSGMTSSTGESGWTLCFRSPPLHSAVIIVAEKNEGQRVFYKRKLNDPDRGNNNRKVHVVTAKERRPFTLNRKEDIVKLVEYVVELEKQLALEPYHAVGRNELEWLKRQVLTGTLYNAFLRQAQEDLKRGDVLDAANSYLLAYRLPPVLVMRPDCQTHLRRESFDDTILWIHRLDQSVGGGREDGVWPTSSVLLVQGLPTGPSYRDPLLDAIERGYRSKLMAVDKLVKNGCIKLSDIHIKIIKPESERAETVEVTPATHVTVDMADPSAIARFLELVRGWHKAHCSASAKAKRDAKGSLAMQGNGVQKHISDKDRKALLQCTLRNNANKLPLHLKAPKQTQEDSGTENMQVQPGDLESVELEPVEMETIGHGSVGCTPGA